jgi:cytochrome c oxidase subunit II
MTFHPPSKLIRRGQRAAAWASSAAMLLWAQAAMAVNDLPGGPGVLQYDLPAPATKIAAAQQDLHVMMLWICGVICVAVFGVMFYSIFAHRKSKGAKSADFHESTTVEIIWTIIPFLIVIGMALPATKVVVAQKDTTNADLTIKATGYQWKWGYDYIKGEGEGIQLISTLDVEQRQMSDNRGQHVDAQKIADKAAMPDNYLLKVDEPMVVPVGKKIRVITTANDVIHSFMVPAFGIKQDAIPGFVRDTWFKAEKIGDFYGQCAELCGKEHAYMPIHVRVVSEEDYAKWAEGKLKAQAAKADDPNKVWALPELVARGEKVYAANCAACHLPTGKGGGAIKPLDGAAVVLDADKAKEIAVLLNGQNNIMPAWKQLSDNEIAAVITYTKNNWSNKTGQIVQPAEVLAARK